MVWGMLIVKARVRKLELLACYKDFCHENLFGGRVNAWLQSDLVVLGAEVCAVNYPVIEL